MRYAYLRICGNRVRRNDGFNPPRLYASCDGDVDQTGPLVTLIDVRQINLRNHRRPDKPFIQSLKYTLHLSL